MALRLLSVRPSLQPLKMCRKFASKPAKEDKFLKDIPQYSSAHSLDKLYPNSRLDLTAVPDPPSAANDDSFTGYIPISKLTIGYARSGGPGGQHAQKTNTKVNVSFHLQSADWIPESTRNELMRIHKNNISKDGMWSIKSEKTRMQTLNLADCLDKIRCYVQEATIKLPEVPFELLEQRRYRVEKAAALRLQKKRAHSMRKQEKNLDI